jgi:hypothetical protein
MNLPLVDADALIRRVATNIPVRMRKHVVIVGSVAAAYAFRDLPGHGTVATKDIDVLLRPASRAIASATSIGTRLLADGWKPVYKEGFGPVRPSEENRPLPALRLCPPDDDEGWFVELMAVPPKDQTARRDWRRFLTPQGVFGIPSYRRTPVAIHAASETPYGIRVARPECMAMANLLEHADPDTSTFGDREDARYIKDVGRAVALWWLANVQSVVAYDHWQATLSAAIEALYSDAIDEMCMAALQGLATIDANLITAHTIAVESLLAPYGTSLGAFERARDSLRALLFTLPARRTPVSPISKRSKRPIP